MTHAPKDPARFLQTVEMFAGLDAALLDRLGRACVVRSWPAGQVLFQRGDDSDHMLVLASGRVRLSMSTPDGHELVLRHVGSGETIGEFALIDGEPRSADATTVERTEALVLPRARFLSVAEDTPGLGLAMARHLCRLLRDTNYQMESIALYDLRLRVVRFLMLRLRDASPDRPDRIPFDLSQGELAAILGASRPKVNRVLQDLVAEGVIRRDGDALVCDREALDGLADPVDGWD